MQDLRTAAKNAVNNTMIGFLTLVLEPDKAAKGAAKSVENAATSYGTSAGREQMANQMSDPTTAREVTFEAVLTGGISVAPGASGKASAIESIGTIPGRTQPQVGQTVYRQWGGESGPHGQSWTPVNPDQVTNFRGAAGLPATNTATQTTTGTLVDTTGVTSRGAQALDGNAGGLTEFVVPNPQQQVKINSIKENN